MIRSDRQTHGDDVCGPRKGTRSSCCTAPRSLAGLCFVSSDVAQLASLSLHFPMRVESSLRLRGRRCLTSSRPDKNVLDCVWSITRLSLTKSPSIAHHVWLRR